ncbi:hypothetical protein AK812_SmicGene17277 [Symbiodinium microadriaticum]|uniref:Uncharacterized protein n=1 Tax=Symbiodinium microadriaticum TaxID=2951 RepID=A0A1Q9DYB3_SYMMI|nr:hypothetical protein AK812_SmicGene17277 [Symbiodinium microadriaticum]
MAAIPWNERTLCTPVESGVGGLMVGMSAAMAYLIDGKITGISGIVGPFVRGATKCEPVKDGQLWKLLFLTGLFLGGWIDLAANWDFSFPSVPRLNIFQYILGGICVGIGTRAGKGCTSGHGICGLPRLSLRSWIAVPTFMAVAAITVLVTRHAIKPYNVEYNSQIAPTQWPPEWEFPIFALLSSLALVALSVLLPTKPRKFVSPLCSGIIFALGLGASGMTSQAKVLNFLDFAGYWDPSLAFVMGCGICVSFPAYLIAERGGKQPFSEGCTFENPPKKGNYVPLLIGTSLFGLGWGLVGVCPGPALAGAAPYIAVCIRSGDIQELYFTVTAIIVVIAWLVTDRLIVHFGHEYFRRGCGASLALELPLPLSQCPTGSTDFAQFQFRTTESARRRLDMWPTACPPPRATPNDWQVPDVPEAEGQRNEAGNEAVGGREGFSANVATKLQGEDNGLALSTGVCAAAASMPSRSNLDLDECQFGDRPLSADGGMPVRTSSETPSVSRMCNQVNRWCSDKELLLEGARTVQLESVSVRIGGGEGWCMQCDRLRDCGSNGQEPWPPHAGVEDDEEMECTTGGAKGNMLDCYGGAGMKARAHSTSTAADHHSLIAVCERYSRCAAAESDVQRGAGAVAQKQRQSCRTSVGGKARGSELDADATIASIETRDACGQQSDGCEQGDALPPAMYSPAQHDALAAAQSRLESGSMSSQLQLAPHLRLMTSLACTVEQHAGVASNLANTPPGIESLGPGVWCRCDKEPATRGFVALCMQIGHTELVQRILTARLKVERLLLQEFVIYGAFRHGEALCCHVTLVSSLRTDGRLQPMSRGSANNGATRSCAQAHNAWWCWLRKSDAVGGRLLTVRPVAPELALDSALVRVLLLRFSVTGVTSASALASCAAVRLPLEGAAACVCGEAEDHTHTSRSVPSFSPAQHDALAAAQSRLESGSMSSQLQLAPHLRLMTSLACTVEQHAGVASNLANTPPGIESLGPGVWCRCDKEPATRGFVALCMQIGHTELVQRILTARLKVERLLLQEFVIYGAFRHGEALCCHVTLVSSLRTDGRLQPMSRGSANNGATRSCAQAHNAWWCWLRKSDAVGGRLLTVRPVAPELALDSALVRVLLLRRLRLPLPLAPARCRCGRPRSGVLRARGGLLERAASRVCREAGAAVATHVLVRNVNLQAHRHDERRVEVIANGLPLWGALALRWSRRLLLPVCPGAGEAAPLEQR